MAEVANHFWVFCKAVGAEWLVLLSGCALTAILGIVRTFSSFKFTRKWEVAILVAFIVIAFYKVWDDEYSKTTPGLHLYIESMVLGSDPATKPTATLFADVSNLGNPSIADDWALDVYAADHKHHVRARRVYPTEGVGFDLKPGSEVSYDEKDMLYAKTASDPIPNGGKRTGLMTFSFPEFVTRDSLLVIGNTYRLSCSDVSGNRISADMVWVGPNMPGNDAPNYPGLMSPPKTVPRPQ